MDRYIPFEKALQQSGGSLYRLAILAARRARDLADGAKPLVPDFDRDKAVKTALEEIVQGYFRAKPVKQKDK